MIGVGRVRIQCPVCWRRIDLNRVRLIPRADGGFDAEPDDIALAVNVHLWGSHR